MKKVLSSLELLNDVAICFTGEQLLASQVAVLTTIARFPGATSGIIANHTGLSLPSVGRLLGYLINSGGFHSQEACQRSRHIANNTTEVLCNTAGREDYRENGSPHTMESKREIRCCSDCAGSKQRNF